MRNWRQSRRTCPTVAVRVMQLRGRCVDPPAKPRGPVGRSLCSARYARGTAGSAQNAYDVNYTYDESGQLTQVSDNLAGTHTVKDYDYDASGNCDAWTAPSGGSTTTMV